MIDGLTARVKELHRALTKIAEMEPGSRGAYGKFAECVSIAKRAVK